MILSKTWITFNIKNKIFNNFRHYVFKKLKFEYKLTKIIFKQGSILSKKMSSEYEYIFITFFNLKKEN